MKCIIDIDSDTYSALETVALFDSDENLLVIPDDVILTAINIF